jgi:LacI family transcriptional regulator
MIKARITIKDIAKELKISTSTVSRALADKWDVNPETRKSVLELAEKLQYKPNPISLSLKQQQTMFIGVIVPEFINSFFSEVIMGIQCVLEAENYQILIMQSNESQTNELKNLKALEAKLVDGFIVSVTQETENTEYFSYLMENHYPLVFFNRICANINAPYVIIDDYRWAFLVVEHLIQQGCRRIIHLSGPKNLLISKKREEGYRDALKKHGIVVDESLIIPSGIMMERGVMAAYKILEMKELPDALFAISDSVAIGAMKTLQKHGLKIPDDIAVVGFSETQKALIVEPNLTSVEQPTFEMGKIAAELLLKQIQHNRKNEDRILSQSIILDAKLNIRESSLKKTIQT